MDSSERSWANWSAFLKVAYRGIMLQVLVLLMAYRPVAVVAQSGHELGPGRESAVVGAGFALHGFSLWHHQRNKDRPLPPLDLARVPAFDRISTTQWSLRAHRTSNILFGVVATAAFTTAIIAQRDDRPEVPAVLILESGLLSSGLTNTAKELVRRPRPYLYNPAVPASVHRKGEDAVSFWSGHTANMAAITFSTAAIVQRSDVPSDAKLATWLGAAAAPALMGYLRVRAGRHFPSDVLVGYLVGAAVGLTVPYIHQPRTAH